jgi:hypothetical protein
MKRARRRWIGAVGIAWLAAYGAIMLAGCPDAVDDCHLTLTCQPDNCDAADADPEVCGD